MKTKKSVKKKPSEDFWDWIANLQQQYWIGYIIIVRLSVVWFSLILTYLGDILRLTGTNPSGNKRLTLGGWIATAVLLLVILLSEISTARSKRKREEATAQQNSKNGYFQGYISQNRLREKNNKLCKQRCRMLLEKIHSIKSQGVKNVSTVICNPKKQLETIVSGLSSCLVPFLDEISGEEWNEDDIYISIAYQFPSETDEWTWATEEYGLSLNELLSANAQAEIQSTFSYLLGSEENTIFFNSKEKAYEEKHYLPDDLDKRDRNHNLLGSIVSYKQAQKIHDTIYTRFVLTITSYSKRFVAGDLETDIDTAEHNMFDLVVSDFLKRINEELCWLYLQYLENP